MPTARGRRRFFERVPAAQRAGRLGNWALFEALTPGFVDRPWLLRPIELANAALLRRQVPDPALRERLRPRDALGCKRTLVSNEWYPTFSRPNVELVTDPIAQVTDTSIVTADGEVRDVDAIVFGTGFETNGFVAPMEVAGRDGVTLAQAWDPAPHAYLGTSVSGFPNLFLLYGPNTNMGIGSAIHMLESQAAHVADAVDLLAAGGWASVEVRAEAQETFAAEMRSRLERSVWESGCSNWYVDSHGHDTSNWPGSMTEFRRRSASLDLGDYDLHPPLATGRTSSR